MQAYFFQSNAISIEVPLLDEQVILFASAVTARYFRIYSMYLSADSEINRCHMFEIIGCQRSGKYRKLFLTVNSEISVGV